MVITELSIDNFRNIIHAHYILNSRTTIIVGNNAKGKTSILESIFVLLNGKGFREGKELELIRFEAEETIIGISTKDGEKEQMFRIRIQKVIDDIKKFFSVDKAQKTAYIYKQFLPKSVLFSPEDIQLISSSADLRREYLDNCIELFDREYAIKRKNYNQALRKRNKLLEGSHTVVTIEKELVFWDEYLEREAKYISKKRAEYVEYINKQKMIDNFLFEALYEPNYFTKENARNAWNKDIIIKRTSIGPQKDDIHILLDNINVRTYGSRSQQRLAVLWLKLRELEFIKDESIYKPILLLDDITSEFDEYNKQLISHFINDYQTIITTTERTFVNNFSKQDYSIIEL